MALRHPARTTGDLRDVRDAVLGEYLAGGDTGARFRPIIKGCLDLREWIAEGAEADIQDQDYDNGALITSALAEANAIGRGVALPPYSLTAQTPVRPPLDHPHLVGAGMHRSVLKMHPDNRAGGPIVGPPVEGSDYPIVGAVFADLTLDGDYLNSSSYNTSLTLAAPVLATAGVSGPTTLYFNEDVSGFAITEDTEYQPGLGRAKFDADDVANPADPDVFTYTGIDIPNKALTGVRRPVDGGLRPVDHDAGWPVRMWAASPIGLFRIYAADWLHLLRVRITGGPSYGFALQGYAAQNRGPQLGIFLEHCIFDFNGLGGSGDNVDIKASDFFMALHCHAEGSPGDKGFNVRGRHMVFVGARAIRNFHGISISARAPVPSAKYRYGKLDTSVTATDTTFVVSGVDTTRFSPLTAPGTGLCELERISWTGASYDSGTNKWTLTGVSRGLNGTLAMAHDAWSNNKAVRVVQDPIDGDVAATYDQDPDGEYDAWDEISDTQADLLGCSADENDSYGISAIADGVGTRLRTRVIGGSTRGNLINVLGISALGVAEMAVSGHNSDDALRHSMLFNRVDVPIINGSKMRGSGTYGSIPGSGVLLKDCYHGAIIGDSEMRNNDGYAVEMEGGTRTVRANGIISESNGLGDVLETNEDTNVGDFFVRYTDEELRRQALKPLVALRETFPRAGATLSNTAILMTDGRMEAVRIWLKKDDPITGICFRSGTTGATSLTHNYFTIHSSADRSLLAQTVDDTSPWNATSRRALDLTTPYTVPESGVYILGCVVVGGAPNLVGVATETNVNGETPVISGVSNTGLTDGVAPDPCNTLGARTGMAYAYVY